MRLVVVCVIFAVWLPVSVVSQFRSSSRRVRRYDPLALAPQWRLFASTPARVDYVLEYRCCRLSAERRAANPTPWVEVPFVDDRRLFHWLLNPKRRAKKAAYQSCGKVNRMRREGRPSRMRRSAHYLLLLRRVRLAADQSPATSQGLRFVQFRIDIIRYPGGEPLRRTVFPVQDPRAPPGGGEGGAAHVTVTFSCLAAIQFAIRGCAFVRVLGDLELVVSRAELRPRGFLSPRTHSLAHPRSRFRAEQGLRSFLGRSGYPVTLAFVVVDLVVAVAAIVVPRYVALALVLLVFQVVRMQGLALSVDGAEQWLMVVLGASCLGEWAGCQGARAAVIFIALEASVMYVTNGV